MYIKWDDRVLHSLYWDEQKSIHEMSEILGYKADSIKAAMRRRGIPCRTAKESSLLSCVKGRHGGYGRLENHPRWNGGIINDSSGYIKIMNKGHPRHDCNGYVLEHILVWERTSGKQLPAGWVVHHLNGIRNDNRPSNLLAVPRNNHHSDLVLQGLKKRIRELEGQIKRLECQGALL